ncbi:uncharacterized protein A1O9_07251 [Exophiala aquamarina CBS 119918]|uniref:Uncharacterized protein n=1 Tax=Exophiala aquamarina CBS 119918 TaxID=1182545 RepID=A0A072PB05_9EURO|nr:uncharacterized protein A1O9_07251 [Exophiala aquamarina CBS 119918]KEF57061.1 hypothetical protein A1O9_07251 [Exophiala aquamarina CBS 119918]
MLSIFLKKATAVALLFLGHVSSQQMELSDCSLLGPIYPMPANITASPVIQETQAAFNDILDESFVNGTTSWGRFNVVNISASIGVFSAQTGDFLSEYHHAGSGHLVQEGLIGGQLNAETLYRIGSVGKVLTVYTFMAKLGSKYWSEPVVNFVPELMDARDDGPVRSINWSQITLGSLARQMSGLPRDYAVTDLARIPGVTEVGLPKLNASEIPNCGGPGEKPCTPAVEFLRFIEAQTPVAASWDTPIYSNEAFQLLGMAFENITGEAISDSFKSDIAKPLDLKRSFWTPPINDANAMVVNPPGAHRFDEDIGDFSAAGGQVMSLGDLSSLGRSVLRSSLLPPALTREWLKSTSLTSDPGYVVGMPWETLRMDVPISLGSNKTRVVDIYSKNGGLGGYSSWIFLSPDHDIGFTILVASPDVQASGTAALAALSNLALATWIPAAEAAARAAAIANLAGYYAVANGGNSSISLEVVPGYKGLQIAELTYKGTNVLELLAEDGATLQYMNLNDDDGQLTFRAIPQYLRSPPVSPSKYGLLNECSTNWAAVDTFKYGGFGLDEFIIDIDGTGKATAVLAPALRTTFLRRDA